MIPVEQQVAEQLLDFASIETFQRLLVALDAELAKQTDM